MNSDIEIDLPLAISLIKHKYRQGHKGSYQDYISSVLLPQLNKCKGDSVSDARSRKARKGIGYSSVNASISREIKGGNLGVYREYFRIREWGSPVDSFVRANPVGCICISKVDELSKAVSFLRNVFRNPVNGKTWQLVLILKESLCVASPSVYSQLTVSKRLKSWNHLLTTFDECLLLSAAFETRITKRMAIRSEALKAMFCSVLSRAELSHNISCLIMEHLLSQIFRIVVHKKFNLKGLSKGDILNKISESGLSETVRDELTFFARQRIESDPFSMSVEQLEALLGYITNESTMNHVLSKYLNIMRVVVSTSHLDDLEVMQLNQVMLAILLLNNKLELIICYQKINWN